MLRHTLRLSFLMTLLMTLSACNETLVKGSSALGPIISVSSISYADVEREVFAPHCIRCHGNAGGVNLETYDNAKANAARSQAAILAGRMPPGGALSSRAKQLLALWISKGMPLAPVPVDTIDGGDGDNQPDPVLPPLAPTYASLKVHVFSARCTACHSSSNTRLQPLTTREEIINPRAGLVNFERPERSYLLEVIRNRTFPQPHNGQEEDDDDNVAMPPANSNFDPVPAEHIQVLEDWIGLGAPE